MDELLRKKLVENQKYRVRTCNTMASGLPLSLYCCVYIYRLTSFGGRDRIGIILNCPIFIFLMFVELMKNFELKL